MNQAACEAMLKTLCEMPQCVQLKNYDAGGPLNDGALVSWAVLNMQNGIVIVALGRHDKALFSKKESDYSIALATPPMTNYTSYPTCSRPHYTELTVSEMDRLLAYWNGAAAHDSGHSKPQQSQMTGTDTISE